MRTIKVDESNEFALELYRLWRCKGHVWFATHLVNELIYVEKKIVLSKTTRLAILSIASRTLRRFPLIGSASPGRLCEALIR